MKKGDKLLCISKTHQALEIDMPCMVEAVHGNTIDVKIKQGYIKDVSPSSFTQFTQEKWNIILVKNTIRETARNYNTVLDDTELTNMARLIVTGIPF